MYIYIYVYIYICINIDIYIYMYIYIYGRTKALGEPSVKLADVRVRSSWRGLLSAK